MILSKQQRLARFALPLERFFSVQRRRCWRPSSGATRREPSTKCKVIDLAMSVVLALLSSEALSPHVLEWFAPCGDPPTNTTGLV